MIMTVYSSVEYAISGDPGVQVSISLNLQAQLLPISLKSMAYSRPPYLPPPVYLELRQHYNRLQRLIVHRVVSGRM